MNNNVLIWSGEHRAYWRHGRCGYTTFREHAGVYSREDAEKATWHGGPEKKIRLIAENEPNLEAGD